MKDVSVDDLIQMYLDTVILYNGKPYKVMDINRNFKVLLFDLEKQDRKIVDWDAKKFRAPTRRLGMVNCNDGVVYVSRVPVRKYWAGLHAKNLSINGLNGDLYSKLGKVLNSVAGLTDPALGAALLNQYPSFEEAKEWVKDFYGVYAFDKQFAIGTEGQVWYKTDLVGKWNKLTASPDEIIWNQGKEHLALLVGDGWKQELKGVS